MFENVDIGVVEADGLVEAFLCFEVVEIVEMLEPVDSYLLLNE